MDLHTSIEILKALADASRLMIVNCLLDRPHYVEELARRLDLADATISFHLKKLERAGLVVKQKEQYYVTYHIDPSIFSLTLQELLCFKNVEAVAQKERIQKYREKILKTFFDEGKLVRLPSQHKKKRLILEEFAKRFEFDRIYTETEVNQIVSRSFEDHCIIRRLMVSEGLMVRNDGKYRRCETESAVPETADRKVTPNVFYSLKKKEHHMPDAKRRKELKSAYLEQGPPMGVYMIKNLQNGRSLIGASRNLTGSLNRHRFQLKHGSHGNIDLQADWRRCGEETFTFEVLDEMKPSGSSDSNPAEDLAELEALWREKLKSESHQFY